MTDRRFETPSGIPIRPLYSPGDLAGFDPDRDLGRPGEFPFTRGVHPSMYRGRLWTMRQYAGFGSAAETNRRFHFLLESGQTGLSVAFDLPTQMGYDSDHRMAAGEVGKVGVAIDSIEDMETLLRGIPLDRVSTSMTINATAAILLAMYLVVAERQGVPFEKVSGTVQNDILKEYVARGTYIYPLAPSLRIATDIFAFCSVRVPSWNTISISGYHIREAGATAVQELAFTLLDAIAYVEAAVARGLPVDSFAPRLSFFFNAQMDFFEEIAKFRAARRIWARIMRDRFGAKDPNSLRLRFHAQTAGVSLTAQQIETNVVRTAIEALAAVLGGAQSIHTNSKDEAISLPSEGAAHTALRTQQVLAEETGVIATVDPLGGSWFVESLTNEIEARVLEYFRKVEEKGGTLRAIESGYIKEEIERSAYRHQRAVEAGETVVVGVNRFVGDEPEPRPFQVDPKIEPAQVRRLRAFRAKRDAPRVRAALSALSEVARREPAAGGPEADAAGGSNLMPPILSAVRSGATLGEISDTLREVFGTHAERR